MPDRLTRPGYNRLYALSGNECAFPDCTDPVTIEDNGEPVTTSEAAHIVARSRQGPRGRAEVGDNERRRVLNHILFCDLHHKLVDARPRVYSVGVLRKMKEDHEGRVGRRDADEQSLQIVDETVLLTAMPLVQLPGAMFRADALHEDFAKTLRLMRRPRRRDGLAEVSPFRLARGGELWAFHDLARKDGPFSRAVQRNSTTHLSATDVWADGDLRRIYVQLLNQALQLHLVGRGLSWDARHKRFWFAAPAGATHSEQVATKTGQNRRRDVAYEQRYRTGDAKGVWCHWALQARFVQVSAASWTLAVRPGWQWTTDGMTPLDPDLVGRKAARKMAHVYNAQYYDQVHFWLTWLTQGTPRLLLHVGEAVVVAEAEAPSTTVSWPAIGDKMFYPAGPAEDDLFTMMEYERTLDFDPEDLYAEEPDPEPDQQEVAGDAA